MVARKSTVVSIISWISACWGETKSSRKRHLILEEMRRTALFFICSTLSPGLLDLNIEKPIRLKEFELMLCQPRPLSLIIAPFLGPKISKRGECSFIICENMNKSTYVFTCIWCGVEAFVNPLFGWFNSLIINWDNVYYPKDKVIVLVRNVSVNHIKQ